MCVSMYVPRYTNQKNDTSLPTTSGRKERRMYIHTYTNAFSLFLSLSLSLSLLYKTKYILYV